MNKTIVLVGNPNVGKSVIFNALTGRYAVVSNYPGTTVDISRGVAPIGGRNFQVIDTPGTNSLLPLSEDEEVTRDVLLREKPDVIVQVADAKNLKRSLILTMELLEFEIPMLLVLNMSDEAGERGIRIDAPHLEKILGIPVVATVGITGSGIAELKRQIGNARTGKLKIGYRAETGKIIEDIEKIFPEKIVTRKALASMLVSGDRGAWKYVPESLKGGLEEAFRRANASPSANMRLLIFNRRSNRADEILELVEEVLARSKPSWLGRLGQITMQPFPGYLVMLVVLFLMYEFVGVFAAGTLVDFFEETLFGHYLNPQVTRIVNQMLPYEIVREFLIGPYGIVTMALTYAFAIVFPIVSAFFFFFGFLEDSGYLPRLSVMLDRSFRKFGLNGKAVLPMVLGLGCGTMAALSSRILETKKERLLVIILLSLAIPCSAQLGVVLGILAGVSWKVAALWIGSVIGSLVFVGAIGEKVIPGSQSPFVLEIPPLRIPAIGNIASKVKMRLLWYLKEAVPLFILGTALLFTLDKLHLLTTLEKGLEPVVSLLGLPATVAKPFILGFLRRDYGAAGLFVMARDGALDAGQIVVSMVVMTLFVPCVAQFFMVVREQGWKIALVIVTFVLLYAFLFGGMVNAVIKSLGIF